MTLQLCGFSFSNYYNKVKLQLLEKGVEFEEVLEWTGSGESALLDASPLGKVPFLRTAHGPICESIACTEYIEAAYPQSPLLPADPYAAAKVRELILFLELHLEQPARVLYPQAYFGGKVGDAAVERARKLLVKGAAALARLAKFSPYVAGAEFTLADCAAAMHLPIVAGTSKIMFGEDLLAHLPWREYVQRMNERAHFSRVNADRKANTEVFMARIAAMSAPKA